MREGFNVKFKFKGSSKLQRIGNSLGVTIPKEVLETLHLKKGDELLVYVSEDKQAIVIFPPKNMGPKSEKWKEASFELSLPKEIAEELFRD